MDYDEAIAFYPLRESTILSASVAQIIVWAQV